MDGIKQKRQEKLIQLIEQKFEGNQAAFARAIGKAATVVWQLKNGHRGIGEDLARSIEASLSLPYGWLDDRVETTNSQPLSLRPIQVWEDESELPADEYIFLPRLDISVSCGTGSAVWHVDTKGQRQAFRSSWAERLNINPAQAATLVASGDSMAPRIQSGDSLVIDYADTTIHSGKVYVIAYDGEWFIKRLFKYPGGAVRVSSDNPDKTQYPDWTIQPDDVLSVDIIGRVVAVSGGV